MGSTVIRDKIKVTALTEWYVACNPLALVISHPPPHLPTLASLCKEGGPGTMGICDNP